MKGWGLFGGLANPSQSRTSRGTLKLSSVARSCSWLLRCREPIGELGWTKRSKLCSIKRELIRTRHCHLGTHGCGSPLKYAKGQSVRIRLSWSGEFWKKIRRLAERYERAE